MTDDENQTLGCARKHEFCPSETMILQDDRDVRSSVLAQGFEMTTSDLIAPDGLGHGREQGGTWSRHGSTKNGRETPTNPVASILAWTRGPLDHTNLDENEEPEVTVYVYACQ